MNELSLYISAMSLQLRVDVSRLWNENHEPLMQEREYAPAFKIRTD